MANSISTPITLQDAKSGRTRPFDVLQIPFTYDTAGQDLTLAAAQTGRYHHLVGMRYSVATAHDVVLKSGTTTLFRMENTIGLDHGVAQGPVVITALGDALVFRAENMGAGETITGMATVITSAQPWMGL